MFFSACVSPILPTTELAVCSFGPTPGVDKLEVDPSRFFTVRFPKQSLPNIVLLDYQMPEIAKCLPKPVRQSDLFNAIVSTIGDPTNQRSSRLEAPSPIQQAPGIVGF